MRPLLRWRVCSHALPRRRFSVDPEEVAKFDRLGEDWWNPRSRGGAGPLHAINPVRVSYIREEVGDASLPLRRQLEGKRVLDVGCGGGLLSVALARLGADVTGVDASQASIDAAAAQAGRDLDTRRAAFRVDSIERIAAACRGAEHEEEGAYDVVCALEVIEHVTDPAAFLRDCAAVVRPGGSLFVSTLNRTAKAWLLAIAGAEYVLRMLPPGTHSWRKFVTPDEVQRFVWDSGLRGVSTRGIVLHPPTWSWRLSELDTDVNYIMHLRRPLPAAPPAAP